MKPRRRLPPRVTRRRPLRTLRRAPLLLRLGIAAVVVLSLWAATNWAYHAFRKPTELLSPLSDTLAKTPAETWREYGPAFRQHGTAVIAPELLAALAQIESAGNPLAQTYWRWRPNWHPFEIYRPASSAVGMYQITDGTYAQTRRECRDPASVPDDEALRARSACWFDGLYARVVPDDAIALAATLLERGVATALRRQRITGAKLQQKQDLAAVIHLCGARAGESYARRGFRLSSGQRCGDHDVGAYLERVNGMKRRFARLAKAD